ncbi:hypothetical protein I4U23_014671 [Adineta vaga]|nr:hypothetical protein I4U23_014671 [Adineta vaga]
MSYVNSSTSTATSSSGSAKIHSAHADNVHVQSVVQSETQSKVSIDNARKMNDLMARLGSTHSQIDEYSRKRTEEINEGVTEALQKIVMETQQHQQLLLADANSRTAEIENGFKLKLQEQIAKLDTEKAGFLAELEKELGVRQESILETARKRIDDLNEEANRLKMGVLREAQLQSHAKINQITEQVVALGHEDATRRLASTTTTVITTRAEATGENHIEGKPITVGTTAKHVESSKSTTSSSSYADAQRHF